MPLGAYNYLLLIPLAFIGVFTSIDDWRHGKIYHRSIRFGAILGLGWYTLLALTGWLFYEDLRVVTTLLPSVAVATAASFLTGFVMWAGKVWSGADAKLFTVFTFLFPLSFYAGGNSSLMAPFVLLVNAYTAAFLVITLDFLWRARALLLDRLKVWRAMDTLGRRARGAELWREARQQLPAHLKTLAGFTAIFLLLRLLRSLLRGPLQVNLHLDNSMLFLVLWLAFQPLHRLFKIRAIALALGGGLFAYGVWLAIVDPSGESLYEALRMGLWSVFLIVFRAVYTFWAALVEVTRVPLDELAAHMILPERTLSALKEAKVFTEAESRQFTVEGLSTEQVTRIRESYVDSERPGTILIERTIPFAPFLFAGLLLSFLFRGVLVHALMQIP